MSSVKSNHLSLNGGIFLLLFTIINISDPGKISEDWFNM